MGHANDLVSQVFRKPETVCKFSLTDWDKLIRQARRTGLQARLRGILKQSQLMDHVPWEACWHLEAAATLADKQQLAVRWEVKQISEALAPLAIPLVILKGGAYVIADLPAAAGRMFNDIDILVPKDSLGAVEAALMLAGWHTTGLSAYDERYYRRWMHELPPMQHVKRATVIDVHHAILPDTARYHPDSAKLRSRSIPVPGLNNIRVLAPEDMLLHSATHLFHDGELPHGLRDLTDLDLLLRHFAKDPDFWAKLSARAEELELRPSLFYAVRYVQYFLGTPVPKYFAYTLQKDSPSQTRLALMDAMFTRALAPAHSSCEDALTSLARKATYIRAHWLRMPPHLLFPHLFHKAFIEPRYDPQTI